MINLSQETEAIIQAKAAQTGRTPDEILREALTVAVLPWRSSVAPPADPRSIDEIIGYDDFGLPR